MMTIPTMQTVLFWGQRILIAIAAIILLVIAIKISGFISKKKNAPKSGLKKKSKSKASGIIFGKGSGNRLVCSPEHGEGMVAVFGGTGTGKSSAILIPTLRRFNGSVFCLDIAGDIVPNVLVNASGKVPGNASDKVPGKSSDNASSSISGNVLGNASGKVPGNASNNPSSSISGKVLGNASDKVPGKASDKVPGKALNNTSGKASNSNRIIFTPEDPNTTPYNAFAMIGIAADIEEQQERLLQMAYILIPENLQDSDVTVFYKNEARRLLQAALVAYYTRLDFVDICRHIVGCGYELLINDIKASENDLAIRLAGSFETINEKTLGGIKQEIDKSIMLFATNNKIARSVRRPADGEQAITPSTLETSSVFIAIDDVKLELYSPLLRLITAQTLEYLSTRPNKSDPPILLALDEFSSLGKLDILPALRKLRKKNVRICIFTQSLADLDLIYGSAERRAMLDNIAYKVVLSATDYDTQRYFSDLAGERRVVKTTYTSSTDGESESQTLQREKIIFPEEFARLGDYLILMHPAGVMQLKKNFYFKKRLFGFRK